MRVAAPTKTHTAGGGEVLVGAILWVSVVCPRAVSTRAGDLGSARMIYEIDPGRTPRPTGGRQIIIRRY